MIKFYQSKKDIRIIIVASCFSALFIIGLNVINFFQLHSMHVITENIYKHPLKASNAALKVTTEVYKIHVGMKNIVLLVSHDNLDSLIEGVNHNEQRAYEFLNTIEQNVLEDEGLELEAEVKQLFRDWKPIRDKVILLTKNHKFDEAEVIVREQGTRHAKVLESSVLKLYAYTQHEADKFKTKSSSMFDKYKKINLILTLLFLFIFASFSFFVTKKIIKHIKKNEHLNSVLSVIRDVNQLIVRQKELQKLIQECCNILTSAHIYNNAWIVIYGKEMNIEHFACAHDDEESLPLQWDWMPYHTSKTPDGSKAYSLIENKQKSCYKSSLSGKHNDQSALNISLKHNEKLYGYLTLSTDKKAINDKEELLLLEEVAGDIAYALYNIEIHKQLIVQEERYRYVVEGTTDGLWDRDLLSNTAYMSPRWKEILGYRDDELQNSFQAWEKLLHPDDFKQAHLDVQAAIKSKSGRYRNTYRLKHKDGHWVWVDSRAKTIFDKENRPIRMIGSHTDITKEKEAEEELRFSKEKFEKAFHNTPSILLITNMQTGKIIDINQTGERVFGYKKEELIGKKTIDVNLWDAIADRQKYVDALNKDGFVENFIHSLSKKNGERIIINIYASVVSIDNEKYILTVANDITEQEKTLKQLKEKKEELETIFDESPAPMVIHNEDGKVLMINKVWQELTGYSYSEIDTTSKLAKKMSPEYYKQTQEHVENLFTLPHRVYEGEFEVTAKNGNKMIWTFNSAPLGIVDDKKVLITTAMNITELKRKDELMIVQSRHAAMGEMIGMIAHQWRQPITGIAMDANNMLLDIATEELDDSKSEKYARAILEQTGHLSKTIDDFRNFFKPDKSISKVKLEDVLKETYKIVKKSLLNNNIELKTSYLSKSEVDAYPRELMQVFVNIINNAKDALLAGHVENSLIEVVVEDDDDDYVNITVCDNGIGIDKAILAKIFDPYFTTKEEVTGTGLGLYMSKLIIEEHLHGKIEAYNQERGACFVVKLLKSRVVQVKKQ